MANKYTARAYRATGRTNFIITFRHPLKMDRGKPGRKVAKGLGTDNPETAAHLEGQMNELLAQTDLHSLAGKAEAGRLFDDQVVSLFYEDLDPVQLNHRHLREQLLPLPNRLDGYERTLLLGITGAGKTTLLRRLIGCESECDRFPSTSVNRTTTCDIEVITEDADEYSAVVTFLSRYQTQQEIIESLSAAVLKAIEHASDSEIANEFLEQSDQRFRLKYLLGAAAVDPSGEDDFDAFSLDAPDVYDAAGADTSGSAFIADTVRAIRSIAAAACTEVESVLGSMADLKGDERDYALDEMQQVAEQADAFLDLTNALMAEIASRFDDVGNGSYTKNSTGWPGAWTLTMPATERDKFLHVIRWFSGTAKDQWGRLLTPLVTGIRVRGPFRPQWSPMTEEYRHVFIDTEGLLHAKTTTEVPSELTSLFKDVDTVLLVESAKNALHSLAAGKVFEAISSTGYTNKFALLFSHMDMVSGENITTATSKREHVFGGARNILENQVARNISRDAARILGDHLDSNTFYFAYMDPARYPAADKSKIDHFEGHLGKELHRLCEHLTARSQPVLPPIQPQYSFESLGLAVREASVQFQEIWEARLGYRRVESVTAAPWQSVKAMSRRYAEGWFDGYWLRPIDTLLSITRNVLTRFLEAPLQWDGKRATAEERTAVIDRLKQVVNERLTEISRRRLWQTPSREWQQAYGLCGSGSTFIRRQKVRDIFQHHVPVPEVVSDRWAQEWVEEVKDVLLGAIAAIATEQAAAVSE